MSAMIFLASCSSNRDTFREAKMYNRTEKAPLRKTPSE